MTDISRNLALVQAQIREAALSAGRSPEGISLLAVTKTIQAPQIKELISLGQRLLGENRPQDLRDKVHFFRNESISWHFIGPLQSNKIKYVYPNVKLCHSVDRKELLDDFSKWAQKTGKRCPCLLEVHISTESSKRGFLPDEILSIIKSIKDRPELDVQGLMGMAPFVESESMIRSSFRSLSKLFKASREFEGTGYHPNVLSMGMSDDFRIAIEEGSTIVRIGRALFKGE